MAKKSDIQSDKLTLGLVQMAPIWLKKEETIMKVIGRMCEAAGAGCSLIVFGEALLPGYPFWIEHTDGARFNSSVQKEIHSWYMKEAVDIAGGDLNRVCKAISRIGVAVILGIIERAVDRGGHSLYCSLVYIDQRGKIKSVHRKLQPTYEERLSWSPGDGHGLRTHKLGAFTVGGLNCWENWLPLARASLYAQGEDLHVAIWPGGYHNTHDLTRFIAKESRSYVVSVSGLMRKEDISEDIPHSDLMLADCPDILANGGTCAVGPDGEWLVEPVVDREKIVVVEIDHARVREERQNLDPSGHYSRPDVTQLVLNRERQSVLKIEE